MRCSHEKADEKVWDRTWNGVMKSHPYCRKCGALKNVSSDRARKMSHFLVVLSNLRREVEKRGYKISEAQIRLIMKELREIEDFDDLWSMSYSIQRRVFMDTVRKYVRVSRELLESVL